MLWCVFFLPGIYPPPPPEFCLLFDGWGRTCDRHTLHRGNCHSDAPRPQQSTMHWTNIRVSSTAPIKPGGCGVWRKSSEYVGAMFHHRHPSFINPSPAQSSVAPQSLWGCPFGTGSMTRSATATADSQKSKHQRRPATFHNILHHVWIDRQHVLGWTACPTDRWQKGNPIIMGQSHNTQWWCCSGDDRIGICLDIWICAIRSSGVDCEYPRVLRRCCGCQVEDIFNKPGVSFTILWYSSQSSCA